MDNYDREYSNSYDWGLDCGREKLTWEEEIEQMTKREAYNAALRLLRMWLKETDDWWQHERWETMWQIYYKHPAAVNNALATFFRPNPIAK